MFIFVLSSPQLLNVFPCVFCNRIAPGCRNMCGLSITELQTSFGPFLWLGTQAMGTPRRGKDTLRGKTWKSVHFSLDAWKLLLWGLSPSFCFIRQELRLYALNSDRHGL